MVWASFENLTITKKDNEIIFSEAYGEGILEIVEFMLQDLGIENYLFNHNYIDEGHDIRININDYEKKVKKVIKEQGGWYY